MIFLVLALKVIWRSQRKTIMRVHEKASDSEKSLRIAKYGECNKWHSYKYDNIYCTAELLAAI